MSRYSPPYRVFSALIVLLLSALPPFASAEVTLNTSVERISTTVPTNTDTPVGTTADGELGAGVEMPSPANSDADNAEADVPNEVFSGDVLRYTIRFENTASQDVAAGSVVITNPLPEGTVYLEGSAMGQDTLITYSVDGETFAAPMELLVGEGAQARAASAVDYQAIRWTYQPLLPAGAASEVSFELLIP